MRVLLVMAFCAVCSVQAWNEAIGRVHIETRTGNLPQKYLSLSSDDKLASRKAGTFVGFIKIIPQLNPLKLPTLGPYNIALREIGFRGDLLLNNIQVTGIKSLLLTGLEMRMAPTRIDFNASVPDVSANVGFQLNAVLDNQPINIDGQVKVLLLGLMVSGAVGTRVGEANSNQVFQVDSADIKIDLKDVQIGMAMTQYSEEFRSILVQFLQNTNQFSTIVDDILRAVLKAINHELTRVTAKEILQYLLGTSARPSRMG